MPNPESSRNTGNNSREIPQTRSRGRENLANFRQTENRAEAVYLGESSFQDTRLDNRNHSQSFQSVNTPDFNNLSPGPGDFYGPGPEDYYRFPVDTAMPLTELPVPEVETDLERIRWEFSQIAINYVQSQANLGSETEVHSSLENIISRPNTPSYLSEETLFDKSNAPSYMPSSTLWIRRRGSESSFDSVSQASWDSSEPNSSNSIASEQDN